MAKRILVTGGTGKTGRLVAEGLRARGLEVRVATRRPAGDDQVRLDWGDPASVAGALDGVDAVYLVAPTDRTDHLAAMLPFLEAAVARGVGPLVLLGSSALEPGGPMMGEVHAWLAAHSPRWVVLRPSWFMQNITTQYLPAILAEDRIYSATGDGRVAFIDAADIAAVAVEALTDPAFPNGDYVLTGPEPLSYDVVAAAIGEACGRPVRHVRLDVDDLAEGHRGFGLPDEYARLLAGLDAMLAQGSEDHTTDHVQRITGRPPRSFASFARERSGNFDA